MLRGVIVVLITVLAVGLTVPMFMGDSDSDSDMEMISYCAGGIIPIFDENTQPMVMSYDDNALIKSTLEEDYGVRMSSPLQFSGAKAAEHCAFFADGYVPQYCTSTELTRNNEFLGNIHMVGTGDGPSAVLGVIQSDDIHSKSDVVAAVTDSLIQHLIFDCVDATSDPWIAQLSEKHMEGGAATTKSTIDGLPIPVLLELTGSPGNYLWKILVGSAT